MWNFLALTFCLMVGTAGLPLILTLLLHDAVREQARTSVAWSLFFIFLLYFTAPAYAAFARFAVFTRSAGRRQDQRAAGLGHASGSRPVCSLSSTRTATASCSGPTSVVRSTDFVVLSMPGEWRGCPFVDHRASSWPAGWRRASTADGLLLTIANAISQTSTTTSSIGTSLTAAYHHQYPPATAIVAAYVATRKWSSPSWRPGHSASPPAVILPGPRHGYLVKKRANKVGLAGMIAGLGITTYYPSPAGLRVRWFETQTIASGNSKYPRASDPIVSDDGASAQAVQDPWPVFAIRSPARWGQAAILVGGRPSHLGDRGGAGARSRAPDPPAVLSGHVI